MRVAKRIVGEHLREGACDLLAVFAVDSNVYLHDESSVIQDILTLGSGL